MANYDVLNNSWNESTAAEYEFYDTIRIKIGYDKGYEFG